MSRHLGASEVTALLRDARRYRSRVTVSAERVSEDRTWTTAAGDELSAAAGDWWVTFGDDRWSVANDVFIRTYEQVDGDRYRKVTSVEAAQLGEDVTVDTLEGTATGLRGDWLVRNETEESWPVPAAQFRARYEAMPGDGTAAAPESPQD